MLIYANGVLRDKHAMSLYGQLLTFPCAHHLNCLSLRHCESPVRQLEGVDVHSSTTVTQVYGVVESTDGHPEA